jgi:hypothetical protein
VHETLGDDLLGVPAELMAGIAKILGHQGLKAEKLKS